MRAVIFPGQGSQYVGMGSDFYHKFDLVKDIFENVDKTLNFSLSSIILNGPESELRMTQNTQPAIMTIGVCIFKVLNEKYNYQLNSSKFFAGHSLGEYTALVCSGSLSIETAAYLLHERGKSMQNAVHSNQGTMMAILGMSIDEVEKEINLLPKDEVCEIANDNTNGQVVVSGDKINSANFLTPIPNIISNVTAKEENDTNKIKPLLIDQINSRVRWRESVNYMIKQGVTNFLEIGPGKVLSSLVKKMNKDLKILNIDSIEDIKND